MDGQRIAMWTIEKYPDPELNDGKNSFMWVRDFAGDSSPGLFGGEQIWEQFTC